MIKVVTNQQMKQMDQFTINEIGIPGMVLMENAGYQSADIIDDFCTEQKIQNIYIFSGKGNNGGDGFVIARHLVKRDFNVQLYMTCNIEALSGDALNNARICDKSKIKAKQIRQTSDIPHIENGSLIIDALLGTGINGAVSGLYKEIIDWINQQDTYVAAIDIPSGLNGNSAKIESSAVEADFTITMALPKCAHLFYPARDFTGQLFIADIGMPKFVETDPNVILNLIGETDIIIPRPQAWQNKYTAGTVFILAGSPGMTGAAVIAAQSASIAGSGLVSVGIPITLNTIFETKLTEELTVPLPCTADSVLSAEALPQIYEKIDWCSAFLIGPGLGRNEHTFYIIKAAIEYALRKDKSMLIDADALFFLSQNPELLPLLKENVILTPHHGEFMRLSGNSKQDMLSQPWTALESFIQGKNCIVNLKGAPSLVGLKSKGIFINPTGNEGLAKGGSGDILAGLITGFLSRGISPLNATIFGNYFHGKAADDAIKDINIPALQPTDLLAYLKRIVK